MKGTEMTIDVAREFSPYPSGRVTKDGDYNGERFRKEVLIPAIKTALNTKGVTPSVIIDLDGVRAFGSSFLEEAFGGLARDPGIIFKDALTVLKIKCTKAHLKIYKDAINEYLDNADKKTAIV